MQYSVVLRYIGSRHLRRRDRAAVLNEIASAGIDRSARRDGGGSGIRALRLGDSNAADMPARGDTGGSLFGRHILFDCFGLGNHVACCRHRPGSLVDFASDGNSNVAARSLHRAAVLDKIAGTNQNLLRLGRSRRLDGLAGFKLKRSGGCGIIAGQGDVVMNGIQGRSICCFKARNREIGVGFEQHNFGAALNPLDDIMRIEERHIASGIKLQLLSRNIGRLRHIALGLDFEQSGGVNLTIKSHIIFGVNRHLVGRNLLAGRLEPVDARERHVLVGSRDIIRDHYRTSRLGRQVIGKRTHQADIASSGFAKIEHDRNISAADRVHNQLVAGHDVHRPGSGTVKHHTVTGQGNLACRDCRSRIDSYIARPAEHLASQVKICRLGNKQLDILRRHAHRGSRKDATHVDNRVGAERDAVRVKHEDVSVVVAIDDTINLRGRSHSGHDIPECSAIHHIFVIEFIGEILVDIESIPVDYTYTPGIQVNINITLCTKPQ